MDVVQIYRGLLEEPSGLQLGVFVRAGGSLHGNRSG
jgi:hypothetical protein